MAQQATAGLPLCRYPSVSNLLSCIFHGAPVALVVAGKLAPATDLCDSRKPAEPDQVPESHNLGVARQLWAGETGSQNV